MTAAPGLLVAAPRSGSGKTTVTLGLQRALRRRGLSVRGAKSGPDYIDPAFHAAATGAPCFNLDSFAMPPGMVRAIAARTAEGADLVVAEASMGLFDGVRVEAGRTGSGADLAAATGWPVLLVVDVSGQAQSAAAVALGCRLFDDRVAVAGVILNKVASERHRRLAAEGMKRIGMPVLGCLPKEAGLILPERHLGLVQAGETADLDDRLERLADAVEAAVDLDAVAALASPGPAEDARVADAAHLPPPGRRVAIARDAAFSFVYPHAEAAWHAAGTEIVPFSPLADEAPPDACDACWLPGGYPELHAARLAASRRFLDGLRRFAATRPVHGECGGYMVLGRSLTDADGGRHAMADLLPVDTSFARRKLALGYRTARLAGPGPFGGAGTILTGHEFHYAVVTDAAPFDLAAVRDAEGADLGMAGHLRGNVSGTFFHAIALAPEGPPRPAAARGGD